MKRDYYNKDMKQLKGFTLIEIIIVIIIVGVLAALALPRFYSTVEFSKSTEALTSLTALRSAIERCYIAQSGTYVGCDIGNLDMADPSNSPGTHFKSYAVSGQSVDGYIITATRGTINGGDDTSTIQLLQDAVGVTRSGTGVFEGVK